MRTEENNSIFRDIMVAIFITAMFLPLRFALGLIFHSHTAEIFSLFFVLLAYLTSLAPERFSRSVQTFLVSLAACIFLFSTLILNIYGLCALSVFLIWAIRSCCLRVTLFFSGCDFIISLFIFILAAWVKSYSGPACGLWTFLLLQGWVCIFRGCRSHGVLNRVQEEKFSKAFASAEAALKRVIAQTS